MTRNGGVAAFESWDGRTLYYTKYTGSSRPSLFARPVEGGSERQILEAVHWWSFVPVEDGIYYIAQPADTAPNAFELRFLAFAAGTSRVLNKLEAQAVQGLTVSPDRRSMLFSAVVNFNDDLMLVEGFR